MTLIIAEVGMNHNGSLDSAIQLIKKASESNVDIVKFQTGQADRVISRYAPKAEYTKISAEDDGSQLEMVRDLELKEIDYYTLKKTCNEFNIEFMSTPFDLESVTFFLKRFEVSRIKDSFRRNHKCTFTFKSCTI